MSESLKYRIYGDDLQMVEIDLFPGGTVRAEVGAMMYMADGIVMQTGTGGGLLKGFKRMLTGESFFITTFSNTRGKNSQVAFAAAYPAKSSPSTWTCTAVRFYARRILLCASDNIDINIAFTKDWEPAFSAAKALSCRSLPDRPFLYPCRRHRCP